MRNDRTLDSGCDGMSTTPPLDCDMCGDDGTGCGIPNSWEWTEEGWIHLCEECCDLESWPSGMQIIPQSDYDWSVQGWICICGEEIDEEHGYEGTGTVGGATTKTKIVQLPRKWSRCRDRRWSSPNKIRPRSSKTGGAI